MQSEQCKICKAESKKIFSKKILKKYDVDYLRCVKCGFIQTENPYWLEESYTSAITSLDIGLVNRNIQYAGIVEEELYRSFDIHKKFADFAGGYGMFTRIMRDRGFDFYHEDKYCDDLFAKRFEIANLPNAERRFELITSFEMMEHSKDPFVELEYIFSMTDNFLFSTELIPAHDVDNWWYLTPEHGQHISFYTRKSLEIIAEKYGKKLFSNGYLHILSSKDIKDAFKQKTKKEKLFDCVKSVISPDTKLSSRTQSDFDMIRKEINE